MNDLFDIHKLLACATPQAWITAALKHLDILLLDHANCEKKAAATAMSLMFRYGERYPQIQETLPRLAREELRHFEQVTRLMQQRGIQFRPLSAARYAGSLRKHVRKHEPERLVDLLVIGALIEARSCERFHALAPMLDAELAEFYGRLAAAESRHFNVYLKLARLIGGDAAAARLKLFAEIEAGLITDKDREFRFHSGPVH
ncbi:MAG TPA: tRNA-(ms[2]io[6]A)-hydroxylase [Gammaproteobacteria bacterium]|nr:tRNA-(ms[2]io[6]A)-hydroxylase [Gammaproteobacteria bacterium]